MKFRNKDTDSPDCLTNTLATLFGRRFGTILMAFAIGAVVIITMVGSEGHGWQVCRKVGTGGYDFMTVEVSPEHAIGHGEYGESCEERCADESPAPCGGGGMVCDCGGDDSCKKGKCVAGPETKTAGSGRINKGPAPAAVAAKNNKAATDTDKWEKAREARNHANDEERTRYREAEAKKRMAGVAAEELMAQREADATTDTDGGKKARAEAANYRASEEWKRSQEVYAEGKKKKAAAAAATNAGGGLERAQREADENPRKVKTPSDASATAQQASDEDDDQQQQQRGGGPEEEKVVQEKSKGRSNTEAKQMSATDTRRGKKARVTSNRIVNEERKSSAQEADRPKKKKTVEATVGAKRIIDDTLKPPRPRKDADGEKDDDRKKTKDGGDNTNNNAPPVDAVLQTSANTTLTMTMDGKKKNAPHIEHKKPGGPAHSKPSRSVDGDRAKDARLN